MENSKRKVKQVNLQKLEKLSDEELKNKIVAASEATSLWTNEIKSQHSDRSGFKFTATKALLEQLRINYKIYNLVVNFSNPEVRTDVDGSLETIQASQISIKFNAFTDIDALQFINTFSKKVPGHVVIKNLELSAIDNVTKDIIKNIAGGVFSEIITVKAEILWQDIIDKNQVPAVKQPKQGGKPDENNK
jgi:hypothetical protein